MPLLPPSGTQYSSCRSNSPNSRVVYSQDWCSVFPGWRWPRSVPSRMTLHTPSPNVSHPFRVWPSNSGVHSGWADHAPADHRMTTSAPYHFEDRDMQIVVSISELWIDGTG